MKSVYSAAVDRVETKWLCHKEKFRVTHSVKKVMLTVVWDIKGPINIDFIERGATVNSASDYQIFTQ